jgi:hypothetical protein
MPQPLVSHKSLVYLVCGLLDILFDFSGSQGLSKIIRMS